MKKPPSAPVLTAISGLSMVELAIVLVIIGIILSAALSSGNQKKNFAREKQTYDKLAKIEEAITNYVKLNGKLPCPAGVAATGAAVGVSQDCTNTGINTRRNHTPDNETVTYLHPATGATLNVSIPTQDYFVGAVPVVDLGLPTSLLYDGWDNHFIYAVEESFTNRLGFQGRYYGALNAMLDFGAIQITESSITSNADGELHGPRRRTDARAGRGSGRLNDRRGAAMVLLSYGPHDYCAMSRQNVARATPSGGFAELQNCYVGHTSKVFIQGRAFSNSPTSNFDDIVHYYTKERLLAAAGASVTDPEACQQARITLLPYVCPCLMDPSAYSPGPVGCEAPQLTTPCACAPGLNNLCVARQTRLANLLSGRCL